MRDGAPGGARGLAKPPWGGINGPAPRAVRRRASPLAQGPGASRRSTNSARCRRAGPAGCRGATRDDTRRRSRLGHDKGASSSAGISWHWKFLRLWREEHSERVAAPSAVIVRPDQVGDKLPRLAGLTAAEDYRYGRSRERRRRNARARMSLKGKTLFITGGSRGIGLAIALRAAADGANVAIAAKTVEPHPKLEGTIHTAAADIEKAGGKALPLAVDVRDEEAVKAAIEQDRRAFRRHRHRGQQRQRDFADAGAADRHAPLRPDASDQHARHLHGVEIRHSASLEGGEPAHPDAVAAARHEGEVVRAAHRLFHGQVRHEPGGAGARRRTARQGGGERAVAAHDHRHRGDQEPARRRRHHAALAHAGDLGGRRLSHLRRRTRASPAISSSTTISSAAKASPISTRTAPTRASRCRSISSCRTMFRRRRG